MTVDVDLRNFGPARREPESLARAPRVVEAGELPATVDARARCLASADIVLVTGDGEPAERAVLEGQASGTPVIVTAGSSAASLVRSRRTGLVCDPDEESIAAALGELASAPALRSRLAAEALETARAHHAAVAPARPPTAGSSGAGLPAAA
jgi:glycosyltransferase involved in cell wall biosynthesis